MDFIIRRATIQGKEDRHDIGIRGDRIDALTPNLTQQAPVELDAAGSLVTSSLVETHIHLDAVRTVGQPRHNRTGSLFEGIEIWGERIQTLTPEGVKQRATTALKWMLVHGITHVRTHVDVCDPNLTALQALLEVREDVKDVITVQIVAFPQQGIYSFPDGEQLMVRALEMVADVVGGIPHYEWTRDYGERDVRTALRLAAAYSRSSSRFTRSRVISSSAPNGSSSSSTCGSSVKHNNH